MLNNVNEIHIYMISFGLYLVIQTLTYFLTNKCISSKLGKMKNKNILLIEQKDNLIHENSELKVKNSHVNEKIKQIRENKELSALQYRKRMEEHLSVITKQDEKIVYLKNLKKNIKHYQLKQEHKVNENTIQSIPSPTEQEHKVKFVDGNINNSNFAKFTGFFNKERIESNNRFNRLVIYWAYKYLFNEDFDRLNSNIKTTVSKTKKESNYRNEYSNKYYVSNSSTKCIYKNIMNIKNIAESKNIKFNLENVYVEYKEQEHKVNENIITPILSPTEQEHIVEFENKDIYSGNDDIIFPRGFTKIQIINFMRKNGYKIATGYMSDQGQWYLRSRNKDIGYAINMGLRPDKCNKVGVVTIILINE